MVTLDPLSACWHESRAKDQSLLLRQAIFAFVLPPLARREHTPREDERTEVSDPTLEV